MYFNKALIGGNLTRDPQLKSLPTGQKVVELGIATNRTWKDAQGVKQEATDYHNVTFYGKQAEVIAQYLKKGRGIFVEGRIQTRSWDDKTTGEKKYKTEIIGDSFQFMNDGRGSGAAAEAPTSDAPASSAPSAEQFDIIDYPDEDINPEDIPF